MMPVAKLASISQPSIRYGSAAVPLPPVTPFAPVNSALPLITMGACGVQAEAGEGTATIPASPADASISNRRETPPTFARPARPPPVLPVGPRMSVPHTARPSSGMWFVERRFAAISGFRGIDRQRSGGRGLSLRAGRTPRTLLRTIVRNVSPVASWGFGRGTPPTWSVGSTMGGVGRSIPIGAARRRTAFALLVYGMLVFLVFTFGTAFELVVTRGVCFVYVIAYFLALAVVLAIR